MGKTEKNFINWFSVSHNGITREEINTEIACVVILLKHCCRFS